MRFMALALPLLLITGAAAALAQDQPRTASGAASTAQPQLPSAVSNPTDGMPQKPSPDAMPTESTATSPVPGAPQEPDFKHSVVKPDSSLITDAPLADDFVMGKKTAPVIMIEYASMSCPHCAHFANTVLPDIQKKYIDTGKMRYILRQFPLNEPALKGAMLLDCVGEQNRDKYFVFAKVLFEAQNKWAFDNNFMTGLETIATVGGVSKEQFQKCTNSTDREVRILEGKKRATDELKVPHTPYILIDGEAYEGDRSVDAMSKFIDGKLALHAAKKKPQ